LRNKIKHLNLQNAVAPLWWLAATDPLLDNSKIRL